MFTITMDLCAKWLLREMQLVQKNNPKLFGSRIGD
jgi:hypothetical protein